VPAAKIVKPDVKHEVNAAGPQANQLTSRRGGEAPADPVAAGGPARRRVPGWLLTLASTGLTIGYGVVFEKMPFGPPLVMLGLGGMTLALSGMALWRVIDPLTRADLGARDPRAPQRLRELEREKQLVLKAIKEIELDHQMRKIADADYRDMIARYRTRAMRLISEIEAGDNFRELIERELKDRLALELAAAATAAAAPEGLAEATGASQAPAPPSAPPSALAVAVPAVAAAPGVVAPSTVAVTPECTSCGTLNDDDARFCKKCGGKLAIG
jgi:hypothetical protein